MMQDHPRQWPAPERPVRSCIPALTGKIHVPSSTAKPGTARADSSWMHNPKHSWQAACVDNLRQPQPKHWQAVCSQKCSHLSKEKPGCGGQQEGGGSPPQPTLQCYPNPLALPPRPCWSQGAPSQGTSIPHCTPVSAPVLTRASPTQGKLSRPALSTQWALSGEHLGSGAAALAHSQSPVLFPAAVCGELHSL